MVCVCGCVVNVVVVVGCLPARSYACLRGCLGAWLVAWLVGCLAAWFVVWVLFGYCLDTVRWFVGWLVCLLVGRHGTCDDNATMAINVRRRDAHHNRGRGVDSATNNTTQQQCTMRR